MASNLESDRSSVKAGIREALPLLLLALSLVIWFSFQLYQGLKSQPALDKALSAQQAPLQNAEKIRKSLSSLALATKQLASQGNPSATTVVNNLAARGINISDPEASQASQPKP